MNTVIRALLLALFWAAPVFADDQSAFYEILAPGMCGWSDVGHMDSKGCYGLFKTDSGYMLEAVELVIKPCHDPAVDAIGDTTGITITVDDPRPMVLLLRSPRALTTGLVETRYHGGKWIFAGELTALGEYTLTALGQVTDEDDRFPGDLLVKGYQLKLYKNEVYGVHRQVLVTHDRTSAESTPSLIWAGDLDGDGKLDLYMDIDNHYASRHYALFLSSEAEGDDLVKLVAQLFILGC